MFYRQFWTTRPVLTLIAGAACLMLVLGCNLTRVTEENVSPTPQADLPTDAGWQAVVPGVEQRHVDIPLNTSLHVPAVLVRFDPAVVTFRVHYSSGEPRLLNEWRALLPQAAVILNGAFFDESDRALGLLVSDGQYSGQSFSGFGGMFQVTANGVRVRSLVVEPYQGEALWQAVQAFPMLIEPGGVLAAQGDGFDEQARRTVVGQDRSGWIIFVVVSDAGISLAELQQWLLTSDLNLDVALGLDGGRSTGMVLRTPAGDRLYPATDQLPSVIAVYTP